MPLGLTWPAFPDEGATNYNSAARTALLALLSNGDTIETVVDAHTTTIAALSAGSGVKVSSDDTTVGFLDGKLLAGTGISLTVGSPAGNETLTIANTLSIAISRINKTHTDSPYTVTVGNCNGLVVLTNTGATAQLIMSLPAGADGLRVRAIVTAAYDFIFAANGTETIRYLSTASKSGGSIKSASIGDELVMDWSGTQWVADVNGLSSWWFDNRYSVDRFSWNPVIFYAVIQGCISLNWGRH